MIIMMIFSIDLMKTNRIERSKKLVGSTVYLKGDKSKTWVVVGRDNRGYVFLDDDSMQDVNLLVVVK